MVNPARQSVLPNPAVPRVAKLLGTGNRVNGSGRALASQHEDFAQNAVSIGHHHRAEDAREGLLVQRIVKISGEIRQLTRLSSDSILRYRLRHDQGRGRKCR